MKRIGILTSGGDCPGLNAVIRAVVSHATLTYGWEVLGIPYATQGLLERRAIPLSQHGMALRGIDPLVSMGGTILGSISKGNTLADTSGLISGYHALGLDALIAIGGDGSLNILNTLATQGNWKLIGIPKTIDNDVALTERAIGFDTAVNTITEALDRLTFTAASHDRVMIIEVMGRDAGHLALHAGIAGGADVILLPEIPYSITGICNHIQQLRGWGRKFAIVVVAEGIKPLPSSSEEIADAHHASHYGMGQYIATQLANSPLHDFETRVSVLGHIQRGGIPLAIDRIMAAAFGKTAVDLIAEGQTGQIVTWQSGKVVPVPINEVLSQSPTTVDPTSNLVQTARSLGIYLGDPVNNPHLSLQSPKAAEQEIMASV